MDPKKFKAPFISLEEIRKRADSLRQKSLGSDDIPVDVERIIEFGLRLDIVPESSVKQESDVDALLLGNMKEIVVDLQEFMDDRHRNRIRFSLAHEAGHLVLHADIFAKVKHTSVDDWVRFIQEIPDDQYLWIEQHAYEFAGRLLVPPDILLEKVRQTVSAAESKGFSSWDSSGDAAVEYIAHQIAEEFQVSEQVISKRIEREKLWPLG